MKKTSDFYSSLRSLVNTVDSALLPLMLDELKGVPGDEGRREDILRRLDFAFGEARLLSIHSLLKEEIQRQNTLPRKRVVKAVSYPLGAFGLYALYPVFGDHESVLALLASAQVAAGAMAVPYARKDKKGPAFIERLTWLQHEVSRLREKQRERRLRSAHSYRHDKYSMKDNIYAKDIYNRKKLENFYRKGELLNYGKGYW